MPRGNNANQEQRSGVDSSGYAPARRSARQANLRSVEPQQPAAPEPSSIMNETRRNPKRKASEAAVNVSKPPGELLDAALAPLTAEEIQEWEGWVELESEPAFFNTILRDLGVRHVKAQEIFTIDQESLSILPKPVYGLIFLFQYDPKQDEEVTEEVAGDVWFANQTTSNACATVAMLNIVMNAEGIELGDNLRKFKESTQHLSTPLRGYQLSKNSFIRSIHNSFTRRMDQLNADLCLDNEMSDSNSKKSKKRPATKKAKKGSKRNFVTEYGFHFVAYVPAEGFVWELDGLKTKPQKLGAVSSDDWTTIARPQIEARMLQYEESQLSFNLLALCQSPLASLSLAIAQASACLEYLRSQMETSKDFNDLASAETAPLNTSDEYQLSNLGLNISDMKNVHIPESLRNKISQLGLDTASAYTLYQELVVEVKAAIGEYRAAVMEIENDEQRVKGRKKDYGAMLHQWVKKLADKGVLEDAIKATQ